MTDQFKKVPFRVLEEQRSRPQEGEFLGPWVQTQFGEASLLRLVVGVIDLEGNVVQCRAPTLDLAESFLRGAVPDGINQRKQLRVSAPAKGRVVIADGEKDDCRIGLRELAVKGEAEDNLVEAAHSLDVPRVQDDLRDPLHERSLLGHRIPLSASAMVAALQVAALQRRYLIGPAF